MAMSFTLTYKEEIEALKDEDEKAFEARGDAIYMYHEDDEARLEWAFYRPSGSHAEQVSDPNPIVSIMAFNHSRLGALERFTRVHNDVINEDRYRVKIRNRSRMLFRAMVDDDFKELMQVLAIAPIFLDQACDQMMNGRIWNETYADLEAVSQFIDLVEPQLDAKLLEGIKRRLQPIKNFTFDEAKAYLETLTCQVQKLHLLIKEHYVDMYETWIEKSSLHPLQRIALQKQIDILKESHE
ncbi:MAG: hypothetical protein U9N52_06780 [Campylobacterota bacterium]|nr:hypothetical protein [Campylobacterota bacterium]